MRALRCRHRRADVTAVDVGIDIGRRDDAYPCSRRASFAPFLLENVAPRRSGFSRAVLFNLSERIGIDCWAMTPVVGGRRSLCYFVASFAASFVLSTALSILS